MPKKRLAHKRSLRSSKKLSKTNSDKLSSTSARNRALAVLRHMRNSGSSLASACREEHVDPRTVRKYLSEELVLSGSRYEAKKVDRLVRRMVAPTSQGMQRIKVRGSKQATELGKYLSAVGEYLRSGKTKGLEKFKGKRIGGQNLITDLATLRTLAQAGALQLEDIYAATGAA